LAAAGAVASQAGAHEPVDLFQSFAEHDEAKDAKPTLPDLENADLDSMLTSR
jgi:hypothetical protein